jgi:hypothetical protein
MPEVQEVFRLATRKVRPDPGFVDRQHDHRRKQERRRKIGAFAVAAAIAVVVAVLVVRSAPDERQSQPAASTPASVGPIKRFPISRHVNTADGVPFSYRVPTPHWERFGSISINKSWGGSQGAEAIIYWSSFPDGDYVDYYGHEARPCTRLLSPPVGPSAADLAAAVSTAPGVQLLTGPSDVRVGGNPAKYVVLAVRKDVGCDPGFFYTWHDVYGGAFWTTTPVRATMMVWIVDVDGTRLFIEAATTFSAGSLLEREIQQIVRSIRFD